MPAGSKLLMVRRLCIDSAIVFGSFAHASPTMKTGSAEDFHLQRQPGAVRAEARAPIHLGGDDDLVASGEGP